MTSKQPQKTPYPLFDSLRAIAAITVLMSHAAYYSGAFELDSFLRPLSTRLEIGVPIFFVISGFLLYRPFTQARLENRLRPRTVAYAWRRTLRIIPAYWIILTIAFIVAGIPADFSAGDITSMYTFTMDFIPQNIQWEPMAQSWTLGIEVFFYAFVPLFALLARRFKVQTSRQWLRSEVALIGVVFAFSIAYKVILLLIFGYDALRESIWDLVLPYYLDHFALGMLLAVLSIHVLERGGSLPKLLQPIDRFPSIAWAVAIGAFLLVTFGISLKGGFPEYDPFEEVLIPEAFFMNGWQVMGKALLYQTTAFFLLMPAIFGNQQRGIVRKILANRVLLYLGTISYSIYLWHLGFFNQLYETMDSHEWFFKLPQWLGESPGLYFAAWTIVGLVVATGLGTLSYYLIEKQALKFKQLVPDWPRVGNNKGRPVGTATAKAEQIAQQTQATKPKEKPKAQPRSKKRRRKKK